MRNFREEYSKTMKNLPEFHLDAAAVEDEQHHRRMVAARRRKLITTVVSAACLFLLCSVGTVTAVSYHSSRIEIRNHGFSFLGEGAEAAPEGYAAGSDQGGAAEIKEEVVDVQERVYDSIETFRRSEDVVIAIPELELLGNTEELESQMIMVSDVLPRVYVAIEFGEKSFTMAQADNRSCSAYASSTVFMGDAVNKRTLVNEQGLSYQMFDSVEGGEVISIHAAISVNGRDLTFSFRGYESCEVDAVLKQLDVNVYFVEK